jgi:hypothetical protein
LADCRFIGVHRDLDGHMATGALGVLLNRGASLGQSAQVIRDPRFASTGFFDKNAGLQTTAVNVANCNVEGPGGNDLYLAGDPLIGGKDNGYNALTVDPNGGFTTLLKDRNIVLNGLAETINPQGKEAFTQYGGVIAGPGGDFRFKLAGGVTDITTPDGKSFQLDPSKQQKFVIGDPANPVAEIGVGLFGTKGAEEKRVYVRQYEKPTPEVVAQMTRLGIPAADIAKYRTSNLVTFGFRTPDGGVTERNSAGLPQQSLVSPNGVKNYYDIHVSKEDSFRLEKPATQPQPYYGGYGSNYNTGGYDTSYGGGYDTSYNYGAPATNTNYGGGYDMGYNANMGYNYGAPATNTPPANTNYGW